MYLFDLYRVWLASTGEDLAQKSSHVRNTLNYSLYATRCCASTKLMVPQSRKIATLITSHQCLPKPQTSMAQNTDRRICQSRIRRTVRWCSRGNALSRIKT